MEEKDLNNDISQRIETAVNGKDATGKRSEGTKPRKEIMNAARWARWRWTARKVGAA
jgi:hypothetical protein